MLAGGKRLSPTEPTGETGGPLAVDEVEKQLNQERTIAMQYTPHQSLRDSFPSRGSLKKFLSLI